MKGCATRSQHAYCSRYEKRTVNVVQYRKTVAVESRLD